MKPFYCLVFSLFTFCTYAQVATPPPPGCDVFGMIDTDNDGYAQFDTDWFLHTYYPAKLLAQHGFDLSGYLLQWSTAIEPIHTNATPFEEFIYIDFIYSGSGPYYEQLDIGAAYYNCVKLEALAATGDEDNDQISNAAEDLNGNGNLTDDDGDNDWVPDFLDPDTTLKVSDFKTTSVAMQPNPAQSMVYFASNVKEVSAYSTDGKKIPLTAKDSSVNVSELDNGLYLISGQTSEGKLFTAKLIKN
jgi:Secretion system C-terminal sorting domain